MKTIRTGKSQAGRLLNVTFRLSNFDSIIHFDIEGCGVLTVKPIVMIAFLKIFVT